LHGYLIKNAHSLFLLILFILSPPKLCFSFRVSVKQATLPPPIPNNNNNLQKQKQKQKQKTLPCAPTPLL